MSCPGLMAGATPVSPAFPWPTELLPSVLQLARGRVLIEFHPEGIDSVLSGPYEYLAVEALAEGKGTRLIVVRSGQDLTGPGPGRRAWVPCPASDRGRSRERGQDDGE